MPLLLTVTLVAIVALLIPALMVGVVWWRQERIAYQPPPEWPEPPADVERVDYIADDGQQLYAYDIKPASPTIGMLVVFHGNADLATWQIPWAREVARRTRWRVFLAEYRGYGGIDGSPTYEGVQSDARAAWQATRERCALTSTPFALFGHSLGSAVAIELASELVAATADARPIALLLQSPFTSARDMARIVSTAPVRSLWKLIARVRYDTQLRLETIDTPIWIAHGERDWLVPVTMGRELFARARSPGQFLSVAGAGHNDVAYVGGESYWEWMSAALTHADLIPREQKSIHRREMSG